MTSRYAWARAEDFRTDVDDAQDRARRMFQRAIDALDEARFGDCREYTLATLREIADIELLVTKASLMQAVGDELKEQE